MASTSRTQGEELKKGMVSITKFMPKERDRETLIDKAIGQIVEIVGQFKAKSTTDFLATYRNEMQ
jgi:ferritin